MSLNWVRGRHLLVSQTCASFPTLGEAQAGTDLLGEDFFSTSAQLVFVAGTIESIPIISDSHSSFVSLV